MDSIYRSTTGRELIRRWCLDQLSAWPVPHERKTVTAKSAPTHVVLAGSGATTVVFVPGANFNVAVSLPPATDLVAAGHQVLLVDVPGQPALSSGGRGLSSGRLSWYGAWLSEVIEKFSSEPVAVMGHSFGAATALSSDCRLTLQRAARRSHPARAIDTPPGRHRGARCLPPCAAARPGSAHHTRR
ncbi:alpha/beta fold hydrolase [Streptomyces nigrescens]